VTHAIFTDPQGNDTGQKAQFPIQEILWHAKQTDRSYIKQHNVSDLRKGRAVAFPWCGQSDGTASREIRRANCLRFEEHGA
jgi:hypothetical protein